jgi:hypothetical protein
MPFAVLFGIMGLLAFFVALTNPPMFLGVFLVAAFVIYYFASFKFLHRGILRQLPLKPSLRDWIRVNAFVAAPFAVLNFMQSVTLISNPELLQGSLDQMIAMQKSLGLQAQSPELLMRMMYGLSYVMIIFSIILLLHLLISFAQMKKQEHLFGNRTEE